MPPPLTDISNNRFAPFKYKGLEDFEVYMAIRGQEGTIIEIGPDDFSRMFFYSPHNQPDNFYNLDSWASGFDGWYDVTLAIKTHAPDINLCLYAYRGMNAEVIYSEKYNTPELNDWMREDREIETWHSLNESEIAKIQMGMRQGMLSFYSLPQDGNVESAYALPVSHPKLDGIIAFGSLVYEYGTYMAEYIPTDTSKPAQTIAFYDGEKQISYRDITEKFLCGKAGLLSVSFNDAAEREDIDFTGSNGLEYEEIEALTKSGRVTFVPTERTPLITPLMFRATPVTRYLSPEEPEPL